MNALAMLSSTPAMACTPGGWHDQGHGRHARYIISWLQKVKVSDRAVQQWRGWVLLLRACGASAARLMSAGRLLMRLCGMEKLVRALATRWEEAVR